MIQIDKNTELQEIWIPRSSRGENTFRKTYKDGLDEGYKQGYEDGLDNAPKVECAYLSFDGYDGEDIPPSLPLVDLRKLTSNSNMFTNCPNLGKNGIIRLPDDLDYQATTAIEMFKNCTSLKNVIFPNVKFNIYENTTSMFEGCSSIINILLLPNASITSSMYKDCTSLKTVTIPKNYYTKIYNSSTMFQGCTSMESFEFLEETTKWTNVNSMFSNCTALKKVRINGGLTNFNSQNSMNIFMNCSALKALDWHYIDFRIVNKYTHQFHNCTSLEAIKLRGNKTGSITGSLKNALDYAGILGNITFWFEFLPDYDDKSDGLFWIGHWVDGKMVIDEKRKTIDEWNAYWKSI